MALIVVFSLSIALIPCQVRPSSTNPRVLRVPEDYPTIQGAVNAAYPGETILVGAGIYYENIKIDKSDLTLIGEGSGKTIIEGARWIVFRVTEKNVRISGFTFRNGSVGIQLVSSDESIISDNIISNNTYGIEIIDSYNVTLRNNTMKNNLKNLKIEKIYREDVASFLHNIDTSNTVDGKVVYYLLNQEYLLIDNVTFPDVGYLALVNSNNITVKDLIMMNGDKGILLAGTSNSTITNVTSSYNCVGIYLWGSINNSITHCILTNNDGGGILLEGGSSNNKISDNWIIGNGNFGVAISHSSNNTVVNNTIIASWIYGIYLDSDAGGNVFVGNTILSNNCGVYAGSDYNLFYHNNFIDNKVVQAYCEHPNAWDNGIEGNYWSDYNGSDVNGDGIGDTPYIIKKYGQDNYPLMNEHPPLYGDVNSDNTIDILDLILIANAYGSDLTSPNYNPKTDLNKDDTIDIYDLIIIAKRYGKHARTT